MLSKTAKSDFLSLFSSVFYPSSHILSCIDLGLKIAISWIYTQEIFYYYFSVILPPPKKKMTVAKDKKRFFKLIFSSPMLHIWNFDFYNDKDL